ncbi:L-2-amino-thiazoline-4-carboxylic acid hydrolase [Burkholderiaceae bacterium FT117]|uniref:L-2-amino-thiazoline-4-carboxylic acid hydrolase n=1 Tax=Zeimonas sediminis TaxID=2944268 RepID=UPI0023432005|nr:L-2-amino-thiazoline-4-carboxylic acid hydrolase [Zeimonas sediminis]MCM5572121.1 L-2-amino-thiazoline-4-carboxylic acid hydrolase [Zeimonas sediminis]
MSDDTQARPAAPAHPENLSMLAKRRIEAEILGHVYQVLKASHGKEVAMKTIGDAVRRSAIEQAQRFAAESKEGTSLQHFVDMSKLWQKEDALRIEVRRKTDTEYDFDVVRCRYAEMYREMGLGEIGHLLSCQRDGSFCEGYDPKLRMKRSQTIMGGASHCDFRYTYEDDGEAAAVPGRREG